MPAALPPDPFALVGKTSYRPTARRTLQVFGAPAELVWLPERKARPAVPSAESPAFRPNRAPRILAEEAIWRGSGCVLTPNLFPFAPHELLVWAEAAVREPGREMLALALELEQRVDGAMVVNTVGAAASIPRAHLHVVSDKMPFLLQVPREPVEMGLLAETGVELCRLARPFPSIALGLRGPVAARAHALDLLTEHRSAPAYNIISQDGLSWFIPRSHQEITAPHFPQALGGAELWGRWCFGDEGPFEAMTSEAAEAAIAMGGIPRESPLQ